MVRLWQHQWITTSEPRAVLEQLSDSESPSTPLQSTMEQVIKLLAIDLNHSMSTAILKMS